MNKAIPLIALLFALLGGCAPAPENDAYSDPLLRSHSYHDLRFDARFKPQAPEQKPAGLARTVSLEKGHRGSVSFELRISPKETNGGDVVMRGVRDLDEYRRRMTELNFYLEEALYLQLGGQKLRPKLVHMENTYGLSNYRIVQMAFAGPEIEQALAQEADLDLVFQDPVFETGISHFVFDGKEIAKAEIRTRQTSER